MPRHESSLTVDPCVQIVIDTGLSKKTEVHGKVVFSGPATTATKMQRTGRLARLAPGIYFPLQPGDSAQQSTSQQGGDNDPQDGGGGDNSDGDPEVWRRRCRLTVFYVLCTCVRYSIYIIERGVVGSVGHGVLWDVVTEYHVVPVHHVMCKYTIIPSLHIHMYCQHHPRRRRPCAEEGDPQEASQGGGAGEQEGEEGEPDLDDVEMGMSSTEEAAEQAAEEAGMRNWLFVIGHSMLTQCM